MSSVTLSCKNREGYCFSETMEFNDVNDSDRSIAHIHSPERARALGFILHHLFDRTIMPNKTYLIRFQQHFAGRHDTSEISAVAENLQRRLRSDIPYLWESVGSKLQNEVRVEITLEGRVTISFENFSKTERLSISGMMALAKIIFLYGKTSGKLKDTTDHRMLTCYSFNNPVQASTKNALRIELARWLWTHASTGKTIFFTNHFEEPIIQRIWISQPDLPPFYVHWVGKDRRNHLITTSFAPSAEETLNLNVDLFNRTGIGFLKPETNESRSHLHIRLCPMKLKGYATGDSKYLIERAVSYRILRAAFGFFPKLLLKDSLKKITCTIRPKPGTHEYDLHLNIIGFVEIRLSCDPRVIMVWASKNETTPIYPSITFKYLEGGKLCKPIKTINFNRLITLIGECFWTSTHYPQRYLQAVLTIINIFDKTLVEYHSPGTFLFLNLKVVTDIGVLSNKSTIVAFAARNIQNAVLERSRKEWPDIGSENVSVTIEDNIDLDQYEVTVAIKDESTVLMITTPLASENIVHIAKETEIQDSNYTKASQSVRSLLQLPATTSPEPSSLSSASSSRSSSSSSMATALPLKKQMSFQDAISAIFED